jgi:SAM-dependent methyltransferase
MRIEPARVRSTFDARAKGWETKGENRQVAGCHERLSHVVSALARSPSCATAADLGSGTGRIANAILQASSTVRVTLCDISNEMLRSAAQVSTDPERCDFVQCDIASVPLPDSHCNLVAMQQVLHHVDDAQRVILEARRLTAPGGHLAVLGVSSGHQAPYFPWKPVSQRSDPLGRLHVDAAVEMIELAGFRVVRSWIDGFVFRFATVADYVVHMEAIGASARLHAYAETPLDAEELAHRVGRTLSDPSEFQMVGEYFTILAEAHG